MCPGTGNSAGSLHSSDFQQDIIFKWSILLIWKCLNVNSKTLHNAAQVVQILFLILTHKQTGPVENFFSVMNLVIPQEYWEYMKD